MTSTFTLTKEQRDRFDLWGVLRVERLLADAAVAAARAAVLRPLESLGLWRDGEWRWEALPRPDQPNGGLETSETIGNRHPELAALIEAPAVCHLVDALLEGRAYERPGRGRRPQVLFTPPNSKAWSLPSNWHADSPRLASGETVGVQLFTFLEPVAARGGGTVVIAGSHRLMNERRHILPRDFPRELKGHGFFRDLFSPRRGPTPADADLPSGEAAGARLQVMELTGEPGDVWLMDLRLLHAAAPNASDRPRLMLTYRFERTDLLPEVAEAWRWPAPRPKTR